MSPGGSLFRGAALEAPDDSLEAWPAASIAPFNWVRIPREKTSLGGFIYVEEFAQAIDLLATGRIDVDALTTHETPLADFAQAFTALRQPEEAMKSSFPFEPRAGPTVA